MTAPATLVPPAANGDDRGVITVLAALTQAVIEGAVALGDDEAALRAAAGLDADQLAEPDGRVPLARHLALWTAVARRPIGLALGERVGLTGLGVVGYAMQHGATVGDAAGCLARYRAIVHPDAVPRIEVGPTQLRFVQVVPPPFARLREPIDAQAAATLTVMRILTGRAVSPIAVSLQRPEPADPRAHEALFGCPIEWSAATTELRFDGALRALPLPRADPRLYGYLTRRVEELAASLPSTASLAARARREIGLLLAEGEPRLSAVARRLALSERTMHRRLREEATGFAALVDEARRERALLLLDDARLSASEISFLLGYAEPAAFFRAFRRWTGETPQSRRARA